MKETRYFYVPNALQTDRLPPDESTHATRVLRLSPGEEIMLIDGEGLFHKAEITLTTKKDCMYRILESIPQERTWNGHIHLAIAPTKMMERMEWLAEKAVEIGFDELSFLDCRFSERNKIRIDRIEKIVVSAAKQSRKPWMTKVNDMKSFEQFISEPHDGPKYICHCYKEVERQDFFSLINASSSDAPNSKDITVLVGPEGDFSIDEVRLAIDHGYTSVSLGESRLRTETAGLMAVAMSNIARRR